MAHSGTTKEDNNIIRTVFSSLKRKAYQYSVDEWVVLGLAVSAFLSIYVAAAAMLFVVIYLIKEKRLKGVAFTAPGIKYLWALCTLGVIVALANGNKAGALVALLLAIIFLIGAFARSVMTRALFDKVVDASCAASIISFAVALIQYVIFGGDMNRVCSVFINPNYYAAVIEIVVLFAVYKLVRTGNWKLRGFYTVTIALNIVGLYFSGCRTAVVALCAAVSLMLILYRRYKTLAAFLGSCVLLAALMVAVPEAFPRMGQVGIDMGKRIEIWQRALEDILKHPVFGEGALAYVSFHFVVDGMTVVHTHSIYLEPTLSFGILGTALILIYLKKNLSPIWKMREIETDRGKFVLALGLLVSVALHGIVDATAFGVQTGILLMLVLSMAGIQENPQPVCLPVHRLVYLQDTGLRQRRNTAYAYKDKSRFS
ncbi:MAG: O-antigen ligase family protein [Eubacteriales bacterium]|nr:O-antigen ligase family protein [Eubacteriales bacterium]